MTHSDDHRRESLSPWDDLLAQSIAPMFIQQGELIKPIGSAFCIGEHGIFLTAVHVLNEYYKHNLGAFNPPRFVTVGSQEIELDSLVAQAPESRDTAENRFVLGFLKERGDDPESVVISSQGTIVATNGSDVGMANFSETTTSSKRRRLWKPLKLRFTFPKPGEKVYCVGHCLYDDDPSMHIDDFLKKDKSLYESAFPHQLLRCEGVVTAVYTHRFRPGFGKGACFKIDCKTEHSQSGGAIFDENGAVCGIIMAGAFAVDDSDTLGASIWPLLSNSFLMPETCTDEEWLPSSVTMHELIQLGVVSTDGSEKVLEAYPTLAGTEEHYPPEMELHRLQDTSQNIPDRLRPENLDMTSVYREHVDPED